MLEKKNQYGLALGSLFLLMHLLWMIVVALGLAQSLIDMVHSAHFISCDMTLGAFSLGTAILGAFGAFISGYLTGWIFSLLENLFAKK